MLRNFFILVFSFFPLSLHEQFRGLMQTSEHAVLHWAHLVFSSQVLDPDKGRYDFQIQWKLKLEVRGENAISAQSMISLLSYNCNCKIELHLKKKKKNTPFVLPGLTESLREKGLWDVICHSRPHILKQNSKQSDKRFFPYLPMYL